MGEKRRGLEHKAGELLCTAGCGSKEGKDQKRSGNLSAHGSHAPRSPNWAPSLTPRGSRWSRIFLGYKDARAPSPGRPSCSSPRPHTHGPNPVRTLPKTGWHAHGPAHRLQDRDARRLGPTSQATDRLSPPLLLLLDVPTVSFGCFPAARGGCTSPRRRPRRRHRASAAISPTWESISHRRRADLRGVLHSQLHSRPCAPAPQVVPV